MTNLDLDYFKKVLLKHLDIEENVTIGWNTKLTEASKTFEPADLLDIFYELGISASEYCSGERLNSRGLAMVCDSVLNVNMPEDVEKLGKKLLKDVSKQRPTIMTTNELAEVMTPAYLRAAVRYDYIQKQRGR